MDIHGPCKQELRPGAQEESASPAWLTAPAMNARDLPKVYIWRLTLDVDRHYIGGVCFVCLFTYQTFVCLRIIIAGFFFAMISFCQRAVFKNYNDTTKPIN